MTKLEIIFLFFNCDKHFRKNNLTTQQIDEMYLGQPFAILQCFCCCCNVMSKYAGWPSGNIPTNQTNNHNTSKQRLPKSIVFAEIKMSEIVKLFQKGMNHLRVRAFQRTPWVNHRIILWTTSVFVDQPRPASQGLLKN